MANSATRSGTALSNGPSLHNAPTIKSSAYAAKTWAASLTVHHPQQPQDAGCPVSFFSKGTDLVRRGRGLLFAGGWIGRRRRRDDDQNAAERPEVDGGFDLDLLIERVVDVGQRRDLADRDSSRKGAEVLGDDLVAHGDLAAPL